MNATQLKEIKQSAATFYKMYESLTEYFKQPIVVTISVLLQNLAFDASDCKNYSHEAEVKKVYEILKLLEAIDKYNSWYLTRLAYEEMDMLIAGTMMGE